ncbi:MAG TPA: rhodanese-like domain-containing protein [Thermoclostridium sp.]|nr:rhodanese-like domain-containing protein [Thermoclostridium sp.]
MCNKSRFIIPIVLILSLLLAACSQKETENNDETLQIQGILLKGNSVLITQSKELQLKKGNLISLSFPNNVEAPPVGSLFKYEVGPALRESWPVQGDAVTLEEVKEYVGTTIIDFATAEAILQHLPDNSHFIDVRTQEEYEEGHISGAINIPLNVLDSEILDTVTEKSDIVIVYCRSGNRSNTAGKQLENLGFKVILDAGGIIDYSGETVTGSEP